MKQQQSIVPELSVVIPCYNEAENLPLLLRRYQEVWPDYPAELILVNNGSQDDSAQVLRKLLPHYSFAHQVEVDKNQGYGHGIWQGIARARGTSIAFSHADMQCDAADVFQAFERLRSSDAPSKCLVKGRRKGRDLGSRFVTQAMSLIATTVLRRPLSDINAQPKVFPRSLLEHLTDPPIGFEFDLYVLYQAKRAGYRELQIPVVFAERAHGESKWAFSFCSRWRTMLQVLRYIIRLSLRGGR